MGAKGAHGTIQTWSRQRSNRHCQKAAERLKLIADGLGNAWALWDETRASGRKARLVDQIRQTRHDELMDVGR